jgi:hypothetical protein
VVALVQLDAVRGRLGAEAEHHGPRLVALNRLQHEVRAAQQRVDGMPLAVGDRSWEREERAIQEGGGVDSQQRTGHAGKVACAPCSPSTASTI